MSTISLKIEFGGGLELLFSNKRSHRITLPDTVPQASNSTNLTNPVTVKPLDIAYLIHYLRDNLLTERPELFVEKDTVRPGILVLVNDTDWELEGEGDYQLKDKDEVVFISTLHGG